jgi:hypothetical protein
MKSKNIFWGILLISVGILWMLKALDIISFSWFVFLKLWPLILVWIGIKLMPLQDKWKIILNVSVLFFGIALLLTLSNSKHCNHKWVKSFWWDKVWNSKYDREDTDPNSISDTNRNFIAYAENFENAKLQLNAAAGKLSFTTCEDLIAIQETESSSKIILKSTIEDDNSVNINAEIRPFGKIRSHNSGKYTILLNSVPVWKMNLELSATAGEIDLSNFKIKELDIESNASALDLKLGNLYPDVKVNIESNASAVEISIPFDMKCLLKKSENNLSSFTVKGLKQQSKNMYVSDDEGETAGTVEVVIASNVSSVDFKRYK